MDSKSGAPPKVRCAFRSHRTGRCMNLFDARGPKKYCGRGCQVRAYQRRTGKGHKADPIRVAALSRDGGCVRRIGDEKEKEYIDQYVDPNHGKETGEKGPVSDCSTGKLLVRIIDPNKPRTLDNVETLCGRHFGMVSDERFRKRIGPDRYLQTKKMQARQYYRLKAMRRKMIRIYKGPPRNPLDFVDYLR